MSKSFHLLPNRINYYFKDLKHGNVTKLHKHYKQDFKFFLSNFIFKIFYSILRVSCSNIPNIKVYDDVRSCYFCEMSAKTSLRSYFCVFKDLT